MSYHHFYKNLEAQARQNYPSLGEVEVAWDHLISPLELNLPRSVYDKAAAAISALYRLSRRPEYRAALEDVAGMAAVQTKNNSVLMAYDFHSTESGECYLVEVNTNASGYMLASLMQSAHGASEDPRDALRKSFEKEVELSGVKSPPFVAITDDEILNQKMYPEFLMYRDWFQKTGWGAELCEGNSFTSDFKSPSGQSIDFVYNRLTDFYLEEAHHQSLREAYLAGKACFSPNPKEYWLLADKNRLVQWTDPRFLQSAGASEQDVAAISQVVIPSFEKQTFGSEEQIWAERKNLFFKPKRSFGGKSVYRGESVSRKVFERLMHEDILIQRFQPAQKMPTDDPRSVLNNWKFDLRFFVYADQIQMVVARIYQGQVTNFSSPMGGFTLVRFS